MLPPPPPIGPETSALGAGHPPRTAALPQHRRPHPPGGARGAEGAAGSRRSAPLPAAGHHLRPLLLGAREPGRHTPSRAPQPPARRAHTNTASSPPGRLPPAPPAGQRTGDRQPRPRGRGRPTAPRAALPPPPGAAVGRCPRQAGLPPPPPAARTHRAAGAQQGAPPRALRPGPSMRLRGLFCLCPFLTGSRKSRDSPPSRGEGGRAAGGKKPRQPIVGSRPAGQWGAGPAGGLPHHVTPERREEGI